MCMYIAKFFFQICLDADSLYGYVVKCWFNGCHFAHEFRRVVTCACTLRLPVIHGHSYLNKPGRSRVCHMSCFLRRLCEQMLTFCISDFSDCIAIVLTWELELNFCSILHVCNVTILPSMTTGFSFRGGICSPFWFLCKLVRSRPKHLENKLLFKKKLAKCLQDGSP